ncbi:DNA repair and recombination protein RadA [Candidatus Woesearchaeota archaeon CG10_big_fil_rev_8_21_14_0_10_37_12]|nr:MAG: DNA repair and recombination protein RadA [Candidatus Woesearchaeota archaeon CG10_big_fil_rev_8_21_14_0_10_37_12]
MAKTYKEDTEILEIETPEGLVQIEKKMEEKKVQSLNDLPGVGPATIEKLASAGFNDLLSIAVATPGELVGAAEMSEVTAKKVIAIARANLEMEFTSGTDMMRRREKMIKITTGSKEFDKLLGGGVETGAITECYGQYGSGKSQLAHTLAVTTQLPREKGGAEATAVYIDTEGTFRPERIVEIAKEHGLDPETALANIKIARAFNSDHQMLLAEKIDDLVQRGTNVKLVVIDSLTSHFRAEFIGRGTLADRQQRINKHLHALIRVAEKHNVAVYVTNQVMSKPDQFFGDPTEAIGGHVVAHASTYRIYLRRGKKGTRVAKMIDAPSLPESEIVFVLAEGGIKDA